MKLVRATIESIVVERPEPAEDAPQGMCMDKGYDFDEVRQILHEFGFTAHIRSRGEEAKELAREAGKKARRWVVERSHSWLNRFRRICRPSLLADTLPDQMGHLSATRVTTAAPPCAGYGASRRQLCRARQPRMACACEQSISVR
jgi:transposase